MISEIAGLHIFVRGIVQGVGFRPFIYSLAARHQLIGWVRNTSSGVEIEVNGPQAALQAFLSAIESDQPPLARIDALEAAPCLPGSFDHFEIIPSQPEAGQYLPVSPDAAICPDCARELLDPDNRRFRYPFINCTHCGPRFTIIKDIPYDRPNTTMADFHLCPACQAEYENPLDRRFHAQPVACPACGPQLSLVKAGQPVAVRDQALLQARQLIAAGKIVAVKGLGGYLLACDACNPQAVAELRRRKQRSAKPFACMAYDLAAISSHAELSQAEQALLTSPGAPIVLLERKPGSSLAAEIAPNQATVGFMLPYTPLHLLLVEPAAGYPSVLVMTSGNRSEEPIAYLDEQAFERLDGIADAFLVHDRPIHMRVDDSVCRVVSGRAQPLRRARGYAPDPLRLAENVPSVLAAGAELKNTFCLTRDQYAFISHHIGDLENYETLTSFEEGIQHFQRLFRILPERIACDLHPDYLASRYARQRALEENLPLVQVQHHHAHLAACLAENQYTSTEPVICLAYDGTGLGDDHAVWGGEVLLGNYFGCERLYHLAYTPLPGGDLAARHPKRMALAHLWQTSLDWEPDLPAVEAFCAQDRSVLRAQLERRINTPNTSSMGRMFDAASALLGVCQVSSYEGQAAIELEALAATNEDGFYEFILEGSQFSPAQVWQNLLADWRRGVPLPVLSARFHNSVVEISLKLCHTIRQARGVRCVALSGGVWQNRYLFNRITPRLEQAGFTVLWHHRLPPNDGCISLGQALVAAHTKLS